jgi:hypothetical protein
MGMGVHVAATALNAPVRAIARADDAAVAITCACVGTSAGTYIANPRVNVQYVYIYRRKVRVCKWVRVYVLAYACDRVRARTMR